MANPILVTGIYVAVNKIDNIPWSIVQSHPENLELVYSNIVNNILELRDHTNLTGYGGGSAMTVITQMVVVVQLVIWMVMLNSF